MCWDVPCPFDPTEAASGLVANVKKSQLRRNPDSQQSFFYLARSRTHHIPTHSFLLPGSQLENRGKFSFLSICYEPRWGVTGTRLAGNFQWPFRPQPSALDLSLLSQPAQIRESCCVIAILLLVETFPIGWYLFQLSWKNNKCSIWRCYTWSREKK